MHRTGRSCRDCPVVSDGSDRLIHRVQIGDGDGKIVEHLEKKKFRNINALLVSRGIYGDSRVALIQAHHTEDHMCLSGQWSIESTFDPTEIAGRGDWVGWAEFRLRSLTTPAVVLGRAGKTIVCFEFNASRRFASQIFIAAVRKWRNCNY